jgi:hemerythrin-like domain-containing protein
MKPTEILKEEHQLILAMLQVIDAACTKLESGEKVKLEDCADMIDFIRNFTDKCHHAKEEKLLFPAMEKAGVGRENGPIGVMLAEHTEGRYFVRGMDEALAEMKSGDRVATAKFVQDATSYINLLDGHIIKENNVLFMMGDERLSAQQQEELLHGFDRVEREEIGAGVHEKYHEMLHRLRETYLADK